MTQYLIATQKFNTIGGLYVIQYKLQQSKPR